MKTTMLIKTLKNLYDIKKIESRQICQSKLYLKPHIFLQHLAFCKKFN